MSELEVQTENKPPALSAQTTVEQSRAVQEVQAALVIAKRFPRDETAAFSRITKACKRMVLAEQAIYKLPIGGSNVTGPSIRLAEVLAQAWGNISFGIKEISRERGRSSCTAYCWDQETNTRVELEFEVEHYIIVGKKNQPKVQKPITDPVEIDRLIANRGARKMRNCILNIMPGDVVDAAVKECAKTVAGGNGEPLTDRIRKMVAAFSNLSITQEMLEERLKHPIAVTTGEEIADLTAIFNSLTSKQAKRSDFFNVPEPKDSTGKAADLMASLHGDDDVSEGQIVGNA